MENEKKKNQKVCFNYSNAVSLGFWGVTIKQWFSTCLRKNTENFQLHSEKVSMKSLYLTTERVLILTFNFYIPYNFKNSYWDQDSSLRTLGAFSHFILTTTFEAGSILVVSQMEKLRPGEHFYIYIVVQRWLWIWTCVIMVPVVFFFFFLKNKWN